MNIVPALYLLDDFTDEILDYFQIVEDLLFDLPRMYEKRY